jgi:hypothetical protein
MKFFDYFCFYLIKIICEQIYSDCSCISEKFEDFSLPKEHQPVDASLSDAYESIKVVNFYSKSLKYFQ